MIRMILLGTVLLFFGMGGYLFYQYQEFQTWMITPLDRKDVTEKTVVIEKGATVRGTLTYLAKEGLIENSHFIRYVGKIGKKIPSIQIGRYGFSRHHSPLDMLEMMASGRVKLVKIMVPPGFTMQQIAKYLMNQGYGTFKTTYPLMKNADWLKDEKIKNLEGYLFPDTYKIPEGYSVKQIIEMMVRNFRRHLTKSIRNRAKEMGLSINEVLTIASIIEKESGGRKEFPIVSSVIQNRLKKGMRLQMDPTVIYGAKRFRGNLTRKDLQTDHPWNTYTRNGLPPTPICNPSGEAIYAAVNPATTKFLYFVAMNNGSHKFTSTLTDHNRAVQKYQIQGHVGP